MTHHYYTMTKQIDGHFWIEDESGVIIEPTPFPDMKPYTIEPKYYKKASPSIQKMVIEMCHRKYEGLLGCSRDSEGWQYYLANNAFQHGVCFRNVLKFMNLYDKPSHKIVFGYMGVYNHEATRHEPKNSVYWLYGCSNYSSVKDLFKTSADERKDEWTLEKWDERDNKADVVRWNSKGKKIVKEYM